MSEAEHKDPGSKPVDNSEQKDPGSKPVGNPEQKRQYWRDPATGIVREIWQPGDGDGSLADDFFGRVTVPPMEKRWRLYLSTLDAVKAGESEPPKYVLLDDKAAYQVHASNLSRASIVSYWSHDFASKGTVRHRRMHRGNPAIIDTNALGLERYACVRQGRYKQEYYFTGEKEFRSLDSTADLLRQAAASTTERPDNAVERKRKTCE